MFPEALVPPPPLFLRYLKPFQACGSSDSQSHWHLPHPLTASSKNSLSDVSLRLRPCWQNSNGTVHQLTGLTHVSVLQGTHVIGAVTTHEGHIAQLLQAGDDELLRVQRWAE